AAPVAAVATVTPAAGVTPPPPPVPAAPAIGTLQIKSVPSGAAVTVDGTSYGVTPLEITLAPRRYQLRVALDGYDPIESEEEVRAERASVVLQLQKSTGRSRPTATKLPIRRGAAALPRIDAKVDGSGAAGEAKTDASDPKLDPKSDPKTDARPVRPIGGTKPNPY
ncbi:MAG: PEGA domain-containing protein, partial [Myxococcota bacterium]|nr:PEGA domain-containing protein [Myxococcota bacterium]